MSIYKKLLEIQKHVDSFVKDGKGQTYKYTTGNTVLNKIRPLMNDFGLLLKQEISQVNNTRMDYLTNSGKQKSEIFTECLFTFTWVDTETGEKDVNTWAANGMNDWDKGIGSAMTYAERYFLLKFFHVPTDADDPDSRQGQGNAGNPADKPKAPIQKQKAPMDEETFKKAMESKNPVKAYSYAINTYSLTEAQKEALEKRMEI